MCCLVVRTQHREFNGTILNFRKDGTPLWTHVYLAPLFADPERPTLVTHYAGIQHFVEAVGVELGPLGPAHMPMEEWRGRRDDGAGSVRRGGSGSGSGSGSGAAGAAGARAATGMGMGAGLVGWVAGSLGIKLGHGSAAGGAASSGACLLDLGNDEMLHLLSSPGAAREPAASGHWGSGALSNRTSMSADLEFEVAAPFLDYSDRPLTTHQMLVQQHFGVGRSPRQLSFDAGSLHRGSFDARDELGGGGGGGGGGGQRQRHRRRRALQQNKPLGGARAEARMVAARHAQKGGGRSARRWQVNARRFVLGSARRRRRSRRRRRRRHGVSVGRFGRVDAQRVRRGTQSARKDSADGGEGAGEQRHAAGVRALGGGGGRRRLEEAVRARGKRAHHASEAVARW